MAQHCLVFDIGKTNKKAFVFDEAYQPVWEQSETLPETTDEDGFATENLALLETWFLETYQKLINNESFCIKAVNISAYGASLVYLNAENVAFLPLYNYLKPYSEGLLEQFYRQYGNTNTIALQTASPQMGSLNSGMQLYRLKYEKPEAYQNLKLALHLPQYLSFLLSGVPVSEITSLGCHTNLVVSPSLAYHPWVKAEGLLEKFPENAHAENPVILANNLAIGTGLHDSSSALVPYLKYCLEPFALISTGTWAITLNPYNQEPLTAQELKEDCLAFASYEGLAVKSSRLFAGRYHEEQCQRIAEHFKEKPDFYKTMRYNAEFSFIYDASFSEVDLATLPNTAEAYHMLVGTIVAQQVKSSNLVINAQTQKIYVDGGFSKNEIYMKLLAKAYTGKSVYAAKLAQASSLGAALVLHKYWNTNSLPENMIDLIHYTPEKSLA
jgi:L-fuculokinase